MLFAKFNLAAAQAFGLALRIARIANNETQAGLAARAGFSVKRVGLVERGRASLRASERDALVAALPALAAIQPIQTRPLISGAPAGAYAPKNPTPESTS